MKPLLETFEVNREDYTDTGWTKYLTKLLNKVKQNTYYDIYGVKMDSEIDIKSISKSYKKLSLYLHPDKNIDKPYTEVARELFDIVANAYEVLTDPEKEQSYRLKQQKVETPTYQNSDNTESNKTSYSDEIPKNYNFSGNFGKVFSFSGGRVNVNKVFSNRGNYNVSFQQGGGQKIIDGDVKAGEVVKTKGEDIVVKGNVYGVVSSMSGDITVHGFVSGVVKTMSGDNHIHGGIKSGGKVETMSGDNHINGDVFGKYSTIRGNNYVSVKQNSASPF